MRVLASEPDSAFLISVPFVGSGVLTAAVMNSYILWDILYWQSADVLGGHVVSIAVRKQENQENQQSSQPTLF
jgi:hypothetical protein